MMMESLQILACNIRSFNENKNSLKEMEMLHGKRTDNVLIGMTEVFRPGGEQELLDLKSIFLTRETIGDKACKGGVGILVNKKLTMTVLDDLCIMKNNGAAEMLTVKIDELKLIFSVVYRPTGPRFNNMEGFLSELEEKLETMESHQGYDIVVTGDFNIDLLSGNKDGEHLKMLMSRAGLEQVVTKPARIQHIITGGKTRSSASLLDHLWTNKAAMRNNILTDSPTDHFWVYTQLPSREVALKGDVKLGRNLSEKNMKRLEEVRKIDFSEILKLPSPEEQWLKFKNEISTKLDLVAPLKPQKDQKNKNSWFDEDLKTEKRKTDMWPGEKQSGSLAHLSKLENS